MRTDMELIKTPDYLLLIDKKAKIKENTNTFKEGFNGDWYWNSKYNFVSNNGDITAFDFKIIAYYSLEKSAQELDLPLLPNIFEDKNETSQEGFDEELWENYRKPLNRSMSHLEREAFIEGYKASTKQFSLEDMKKAIEMAREYEFIRFSGGDTENKYTEEEIIQSLSTQQLPKEFIPEYDIVHTDHAPNGFEKFLKFKTNSEGKKEIQGTYKY